MKKKKEKKKGKNRKAEKQLKKGKIKAGKGLRPGKAKELVKALKKEIRQLNRELQLRDEQLQTLTAGGNSATAASEADILAQTLTESPGTGSVSERKKAWERHQYLRSRYEFHLEAGLEKVMARRDADQDLRARYGNDAGYTEEQLDSILS